MPSIAIHYYWGGLPFEVPRYCRPLLQPKRSTKDIRKVTCRACLKKLARRRKDTMGENESQ